MTSALPRSSPAFRTPEPGAIVWAAAALVVIVSILSLSIGPTGISLASLPRAISSLLEWTDSPEARRESLVLLGLRLPRTLLGLAVGASLATAGVMMQGLFRNPLADPGLIGVSSGAALAAVTTIALGNGIALGWTQAFGVYALPFAAFAGGMATTLALVAVASRRGELAIGTLLLAGVAFTALALALIGLIAQASDDRELRDITLWQLGSLSGSSWPKVMATLPLIAVLVVLVPRLTRVLNGLLLGESEAFHLGIDVRRSKLVIIVATAAAVAIAVAVAGPVGFVGLVTPHIVRLIAGPDHRIVLPASALLGAALAVAADIVARMAFRPAEIPLGIVMAIIGAPVLLHLVTRRGIGGME